MLRFTDQNWSFEALPQDLFSQKYLEVTPGRVATPRGRVALLEAGPTGQHGLSYQEGENPKIRLASAVNPAAEDRALIAGFQLNPQQGVVCVGLGLGYQVEELLKRLEPGVPVWILESRPELAACAFLHRDLSKLLNRPEVHFILGPFDQPFRPKEPLPSQILWRPATFRHLASEYPLFLQKPKPKLHRVQGRNPKVLLFQSGYFLDREIKNAAEALGWETASWHFERKTTASEANFKELFSQIKSFKPGLILTVNHLGFDAQGILDDLLTKLKIPVATWFVDSPTFILENVKPGPGVTAFSWDRDYLPLLRAQGFKEVHYLPLATDETFFSPTLSPPSFAREVAFVGDSLTTATTKYLGKLGLTPHDPQVPSFLAAIDREATAFLSSPELLPPQPALRKLAGFLDLTPTRERLSDLAALITWRGSRLKRLKILQTIAGPILTVAGDKGWGGLLKLKVEQMMPIVDYYTELASFYQSSQINLNITSAQMKSGLNQRVFDVPASGAFLLTDDQGQLAELFEPGQEVITYRHPEEARDLGRWYAHHPQARQAIISAGHRRVHQHHLYRHRLAKLATILRG